MIYDFSINNDNHSVAVYSLFFQSSTVMQSIYDFNQPMFLQVFHVRKENYHTYKAKLNHFSKTLLLYLNKPIMTSKTTLSLSESLITAFTHTMILDCINLDSITFSSLPVPLVALM